MRLENLFEQQFLFENFNDFERVYNEVRKIIDNDKQYDFFIRKIELTESDILHLAKELGIKGTTVPEVYAKLFRSNVTFYNSFGDKIDREKMNVNSMVKYLKNKKDNTVSLVGTLDAFVTTIEKTLQELKARQSEKQGKDEYKVIHKDENWIVFKPEHKGAACRLGSDTRWCISSRGSRNSYDVYADENDIYIIHTKNEKYAIIVEKESREVIEVQKSDNNNQVITLDTVIDFFKTIRNDGVDIEVLADKINIDTTFMNRIYDIRFDIETEIDSSNEKEIKVIFYVEAFYDKNTRYKVEHTLYYSSLAQNFITPLEIKTSQQSVSIINATYTPISLMLDNAVPGYIHGEPSLEQVFKRLKEKLVEEIGDLKEELEFKNKTTSIAELIGLVQKDKHEA